MTINYLITKREDLSTRALNVINRFDKIVDVVEYYRKNGHFKEIRNCGTATSIELSSYCEYLILHNNNEECINIPLAIEKIELPHIQLPYNILECIQLFLSKVDSSSLKTKKIINKLQGDSFYDNINSQLEFMKSYIFGNFDFGGIMKKNSISFREIELIIREISAVAKFNNLENEEITSKDSFIHLIASRLHFKIPNEQIENSLNDTKDSLCFHKLLFAFINISLKKSKYKEVFNLYYTSHIKIKLSEIGKKVGISRERVRQILQDINSKSLPTFVHKLDSALDNIDSDIKNMSVDPIVWMNMNSSIFLNDKSLIKPNKLFVSDVIMSVLKDNYIHINKLALPDDNNIRSFVKTDEIIFISKLHVTQYNLHSFFKWIDEEIYSFYISNFSYNLDILIKRYFQEKGIEISFTLIKYLQSIVELLIRREWDVYKGSKDKSERKYKNEQIIDLCFDYIKERNTAILTLDLLDFLEIKYIDISKNKLLQLLGKNKARFIRAGNGLWTIPDIAEFNGGSIRSMIFDLISKNKEPMHISELLNYINQFRSINESSLKNNLRVEESGLFVFYNCGYIGIKGKEYDPLFGLIPKFNPRNLKKGLEYSEEKIKQISEQYGYPKIHLDYILGHRNIL